MARLLFFHLSIHLKLKCVIFYNKLTDTIATHFQEVWVPVFLSQSKPVSFKMKPKYMMLERVERRILLQHIFQNASCEWAVVFFLTIPVSMVTMTLTSGSPLGFWMCC